MQKSINLSTASIVIFGLVIFFGGMLFALLFWTPFSRMMPWGMGFGGGFMHGGYPATGGMMGQSADIRNDSDFLMGMIPHHQEAVDTATYALTKTNDTEMKTFLQGIINAQTSEIAQMKSWYRAWYGKDYVADQRYQSMMPDLKTIQDNQVIPAFLQGMIMHHMGAIEMARAILPIAEHAEISTFAQDVIRVQSEEIRRMVGWLSAKAGYAPMMMY